MLDVVLEVLRLSILNVPLSVSILVVLDVVLEVNDLRDFYNLVPSFNPCCAGCSSGRLDLKPFIVPKQ